ncbi:MAG TPA: hypothetical protein VGA47_08605 [Candidatus Dormibacteraeota bacterium]
MNRFVVGMAGLLLLACGGPGGSGPGASGPPSAQSVAGGESDFAGLTRCTDSGTWEDYLKAEQQSDPSSYEEDKAQWDKIKAAGAEEGYVADYAQNQSDCGGLTSDVEPTGKVVYVFVIRFKDESSAKANFKDNAKDFHLSDSDVADARAAGATVAQGSATGLGDNSIEAYGSVLSTSFFFGFWQNKTFEAGVITFNEPSSDSLTRTKNVNGRIR